MRCKRVVKQGYCLQGPTWKRPLKDEWLDLSTKVNLQNAIDLGGRDSNSVYKRIKYDLYFLQNMAGGFGLFALIYDCISVPLSVNNNDTFYLLAPFREPKVTLQCS